MTSPPMQPSVWAEIGHSWMGLKTWVKYWLFWLNAVFLAALALPPQPLRWWILLAYVAAGGCLLPIMLVQRGLSRLLGVGHLLPWIPLLIYLSLRMGSSAAGPQIRANTDPAVFSYVIVLMITLEICLGFDLVDVVRWFRGERYLMGSPDAVQARASQPARSLFSRPPGDRR